MNCLSMSVYNEDYLIALEYTMPHIIFLLFTKKTTEMMLNLNMCYGNMSSGVSINSAMSWQLTHDANKQTLCWILLNKQQLFDM